MNYVTILKKPEIIYLHFIIKSNYFKTPILNIDNRNKKKSDLGHCFPTILNIKYSCTKLFKRGGSL